MVVLPILQTFNHQQKLLLLVLEVVKQIFHGYINDVRLYKGTAKYTSNFIPASTNPDILPDTPSGVSGSSKLTKITDGAVKF